jgi:TM2 domain-containing membrane protein YozV
MSDETTDNEPQAEVEEPRAEADEPQAEADEPRAEADEPRAEADEPRAEADEPQPGVQPADYDQQPQWAATPPPQGHGYPPPQGLGYPPPGPGYPPPGYGYGPPPSGYGYWPPPPPPGYPPIPPGVDPAFKDKKLAAGLCGILVGSLGVHKFILGYKNEGLTMLLVSVLTLGFGAIIMSPIGLIEGIIYLTKSDYDFVMTYGVHHKGWF